VHVGIMVTHVCVCVCVCVCARARVALFYCPVLRGVYYYYLDIKN